jgi:hypothetical protein
MQIDNLINTLKTTENELNLVKNNNLKNLKKQDEHIKNFKTK